MRLGSAPSLLMLSPTSSAGCEPIVRTTLATLRYGGELGVRLDRVVMTHPIVFSLEPDASCTRILGVVGGSLGRMIRYYRGKGALPDVIRAEWIGDETLREGDFPCGIPTTPFLSARIVERFRPQLLASGRLVPVEIDGAPQRGEYWLYVADHVADCLDVKRSSRPRKATDSIMKAVFDPSRVPTDVAAFRIPQAPTFVLWTRGFVETLMASAEGVRTRVVWSADPSFRAIPGAMR